MLKRLFLTVLSATALGLPAFADITSESTCTVDVLGVSQGSVNIEAAWDPLSYTCTAGEYLDANQASCLACKSGSFCTGLENVVFNGTDQGIQACPVNYTSDVGTPAESQCWQIYDVNCAEYNPYTLGHGQAVYNNTVADCKHFYGANGCETVVAGACDIDHLNCDAHYSQELVSGQMKCVQTEVACPVGTYLPGNANSCAACLADSYCVGGVYPLGAADDAGMVACESGLFAPAGARSVNDCGRLLHVGNDVLHLHTDKRTEHSLVVRVDDVKYYADTTPVSEGVKTINPNTTQTLKIRIDGVEYYVHETIYE